MPPRTLSRNEIVKKFAELSRQNISCTNQTEFCHNLANSDWGRQHKISAKGIQKCMVAYGLNIPRQNRAKKTLKPTVSILLNDIAEMCVACAGSMHKARICRESGCPLFPHGPM